VSSPSTNFQSDTWIPKLGHQCHPSPRTFKVITDSPPNLASVVIPVHELLKCHAPKGWFRVSPRSKQDLAHSAHRRGTLGEIGWNKSWVSSDRAKRGEEWGPGHYGKGVSFFCFFGGATNIGSGRVYFFMYVTSLGSRGKQQTKQVTNEANDGWRAKPKMFLFFIVIEIERIGGPNIWTPHFKSTSKAQSVYREG
jgi:hypothetical protein